MRRYSWPKGHWAWPVALTHKHGVRAGNMVFTGGQVDLDDAGTVRNPCDLVAQTDGAMAYMQVLLADLGVGFDDLVRLVVYFVGDAAAEQVLLRQLADIIGPNARPVINMIGLPELCYPEMMVEIEAVAMRAPDGALLPRQCLRLDHFAPLPDAFSHVVACDGLIFTGDISAIGAHPGRVFRQTRSHADRYADGPVPRPGCHDQDLCHRRHRCHHPCLARRALGLDRALAL